MGLIEAIGPVLIIDNPIWNSAVDSRHTAIARIGQLEIFDPFCDGTLCVGTGHNPCYASCQTGRIATTQIAGVRRRHDLISNTLQQAASILLLEPERRWDRHADGAG